MGWQPIETAPKDGRFLLLFGPEGGVAPDGEYGVPWWCVANWGPTWNGLLDWSSGDDQPPLKPTHWMPLPEPPATEEPA